MSESPACELPEDVPADLDVLEQVGRELLLPGPPVRLPVVDDADAETAGMHLLAHQATSFFLRRVVAFGFASASGAACSAAAGFEQAPAPRRIRRRLLGEDEGHVAGPLLDPVDAAARAAFSSFSVGPSSAYAASTTSSSPSSPWFASAFATAERSTFSMSVAGARRERGDRRASGPGGRECGRARAAPSGRTCGSTSPAPAPS